MAKRKRKDKKARSKPDFIVANNGHVEIVTELRDNPFAYGVGTGLQRYKQTVNRRTSPVVEYCNRKRIDTTQRDAALRFEAAYALSGATVRALNYAFEPVDGGGGGDAFNDARVNAIKQLMRADSLLGRPGYMLIESVCGHGLYIKDMTTNTRQADDMMRRLRDCLNILAENW